MRIAMLLGLAAACLLAGCSDDETEPTGELDAAVEQPDAATEAAVEQDAASQEDAQLEEDASTADSALPACPDEVDLRTVTLPCDCYGHEANETTIVDPNCQTNVVCCPSVSNLRCEDHEYIDAATDADPADVQVGDAEADAPQEAAVKKCPNEVDLSTTTLPCDCYGTIVEDPAQAMPECTLSVVCCPGLHGLKCE